VLGERLGVVLFQCPPNLKADLDRLEAFLDLLEPGIRAVFEFRHESWLEDATRDVLRDRGCALCLADNDDEPEPELFATAGFGYLRLRRAHYDGAALDRWMQRVKAQPWQDAFVFFKHEDAAGGPRMAAAFLAAQRAD
jgi:uncharacterized protein YecE (DUF72 family)